MWSDRDGPQLFDTVDELPSARFFPKGVVHSVKPYLRSRENDESTKLLSENKVEETETEHSISEKNGKKNGVKWRRKGARRRLDTAGQSSFDGKTSNLKSEAYDGRSNLKSEAFNKRSNLKSEVYDKSRNLMSEVYDKSSNLRSEVYDVSLQRDGSYGIKKKK